jgi:hypothetical protein
VKGKTMKKIITEVENEGLMKLIGETVTLFCASYIYTGKLTGVNESCVLLTDAKIVYETGAFNEKSWKDAQDLPHDWHVQIGMIESFGILKV